VVAAPVVTRKKRDRSGVRVHVLSGYRESLDDCAHYYANARHGSNWLSSEDDDAFGVGNGCRDEL